MADKLLSELPASTSLASADLLYAQVGNTGRRITSGDFGQAITAVIDVKRDFGAVGDGVTDDTAALNLVRDEIESRTRTNPAPGSNTNLLSDVTVVFPAGDYLVTSAEALIRSTFTTRTVGLKFKGVGGVAQILFQPTVSGALFNFNDSFLGVDFEDLIFHCNDSASDFWNSTSSGGTQNIRFKRCEWQGSWQYGFRLQGTNNNAEYRWQDCGCTGSVLNAFLWLETSDQFLNYWFDRFTFQSEGTWVRATLGGSIHIINSDVSGYLPTSQTYLFELLGTSHSRGVTSFSCRDTRMELRSDNANVLHSQWPHGSVVFDNVDMSSSGAEQTDTVENFLIDFQNTAGAMYSFRNSSFIGKIAVEYGVSGHDFAQRISFREVSILDHANPEDFITITRTGAHGNRGGSPVIKFENSRSESGTDTDERIWDFDLGWHEASNAPTSMKWVRLATAQGGSPISNGFEAVFLPPNVIVTRVRMHLPAGSTGEAKAMDFDVQSNEGSPTVLASSGTALHSAGYDVDTAVFFRVGTDLLKREIRWVDNALTGGLATSPTDAMCLVEYIG